jgi:hypothetical protein
VASGVRRSVVPSPTKVGRESVGAGIREAGQASRRLPSPRQERPDPRVRLAHPLGLEGRRCLANQRGALVAADEAVQAIPCPADAKARYGRPARSRAAGLRRTRCTRRCSSRRAAREALRLNVVGRAGRGQRVGLSSNAAPDRGLLRSSGQCAVSPKVVSPHIDSEADEGELRRSGDRGGGGARSGPTPRRFDRRRPTAPRSAFARCRRRRSPP